MKFGQINYPDNSENVHQQNSLFIIFHLFFISCEYVLKFLSDDI